MMTSLVFFPRKHCSLPTTLEMGKLNNYRLLHHACLLSLKNQTSQVEPPWRYNFCAYIFKISRYATVTSTEMDDLSY